MATPTMHLLITSSETRIHLEYLLEWNSLLALSFKLRDFSEIGSRTYHYSRGQRFTVIGCLNRKSFIFGRKMILDILVYSVQLALTHFQSLKLDRQAQWRRFMLFGVLLILHPNTLVSFGAWLIFDVIVSFIHIFLLNY